jgi:hypothetical protein
MLIKEMTEGKKIAYRLNGNILYLGDNDEIEINLNQRQKDVAVAIDVYLDADMLSEGVGRHYAANILIPPGRYKEVLVNSKDMQGNDIVVTQKEPLSVDVNAVVLQLWGIPEKIKGGM